MSKPSYRWKAGSNAARCLAHVYGNTADRPERQRRYPSDMTEAEGAAIRPLLPVPGLDAQPGRPAGGVLPPRNPAASQSH